MKSNQEYTPKYWVFHNTLDDQVFINTWAKSLGDCRVKACAFYSVFFNDYNENDSTTFKFSLIEIKLVTDGTTDNHV